MGFKDNWKKLVAWWANNALANQNKISQGISWYLLIVISALGTTLTSMLTGDFITWTAFFVVFITASVGLLIMVIESVFGKAKAPEGSTSVITSNQ